MSQLKAEFARLELPGQAAASRTSRRNFLKGIALTAGSLLVPISLVRGADASYEITDWIRLDPNGRTIIGVSQCEVGQGTFTGLPQVVADELDADWSTVSVEFVTGRDAYRITAANEESQQFVGASMSVTQFTQRLRIAGAQAREALIQAAAERFKTRFTLCETKLGRVYHAPTGRSFSYGELAQAASKLPLNPDPRLKAPSERTLMGKNLRRLDTPAKVDGSAIFGIDVRVPDMLFGALRMAPTQTGKVIAIKNEAEIRARPGVKAVVKAPFWPRNLLNAVIVVADSYWIAKTAADALVIEFDEGAAAGSPARRSWSSASRRWIPTRLSWPPVSAMSRRNSTRLRARSSRRATTRPIWFMPPWSRWSRRCMSVTARSKCGDRFKARTWCDGRWPRTSTFRRTR